MSYNVYKTLTVHKWSAIRSIPPTRDWKNYKPKPKRKKLNIGFKMILKEAQEEINTAENSLNGHLGVSK